MSESYPLSEPAAPLRYRVERLADLRNEGRWGVFNVEANRWLDIRFSSEADAVRASMFLCKVRAQ
jgi:hypothetical protein